MEKILIKNISHCCGFENSVGTPFSILIDKDGKIDNPDQIEQPGDCEVIDASGLWLSPGWIDMHTHVYKGVCDIGLDPDLIGPAQGVAALVDAGSAGQITFPGLRDYVIRKHDYEIYAFLNFGSAGIIRANIISEYETDDFVEPDATIACIEQNREYIKGLKLRTGKETFKGRLGIDFVRKASDTAREAQVPLMVHVSKQGSGPGMGEILNELHAGDILTHCFNGYPGGILSQENGQIIKEARAARDRGVLFDIGHGAGSFSYQIGKEAIARGFKPDFIGTDLHGWSYPLPVGSLSTTLAKLIACGLDAEEAIRMVTQKPIEFLKLDKNRLKPGTKACFTLFRFEEREKTVFDAMKNPFNTHIQALPVMTIIGSEKYRSNLT
jgi:dihydroorotase